MIDYLRLQNFKCWEDTGEIKLSPITVFFGANSAGKSSVGQFLMMLKQSVESSDRKNIFFTGNEQSLVDVGLPADMIFNKENHRHILFQYGWEMSSGFEINNAITKAKTFVERIDFSGDVRVIEGTQSMEVESIDYLLSNNSGKKLDFSLHKKIGSKPSKSAYLLSSDAYEFKRALGRPWDITSVVRFYGFPDEAVAYYQNADFLQTINLYHEKLFSTLYYLGPLRNRAKRLYTWQGNTPRDTGINGEEAISAILASREEKRLINLSYKGLRRSLEAIVAKELQKMSLIDSFDVRQISHDRQDYEVKIRTKGDQQYVDIPDVGVGVSQVLPVIVQLFYAPPGSTIIIEQPELHLHPSAQASLADVVIDAIHAREDSKNRNIQIIIESHSEHFLRRLQRRLAEEVLRQDELAAYFVNFVNGAASLESLDIDLFGDITNWPKDFFGDIAGDIYKQANAAYKKRIKGDK